MKVEVEFTKDYATKKKGEKGVYDSMLSSQLIRSGVAKKAGVKTGKKVDK